MSFMSQFFEANARWNKGTLFSSDGYVKDLLKQYGNGGRPVVLPKMSKEMYEDGMRFRTAEKQHYASLEQQLADATTSINRQEAHMRQMQSDNVLLSAALDEFLTIKQDDATSRNRGSVSQFGGDGGGHVLPPQDRPSADDGNFGQPEVIISSTEAGHEPPHARRNRSRRDNAKLDVSEEGGENGTQRSDTGRASPDATDGSKSDVGGSTDQHGVEE